MIPSIVAGVVAVALLVWTASRFARQAGENVERMSDEWDRSHRYEEGKRGHEL